MKMWTLIIVAVVAAAITFGQWAVVMGNDAFTVYGPGNHKVFTYGFPFRIVECAPELPIHTPGWQTPFRFLGNFAVFVGVGISVVWIFGRLGQRVRVHSHVEGAA